MLINAMNVQGLKMLGKQGHSPRIEQFGAENCNILECVCIAFALTFRTST